MKISTTHIKRRLATWLYGKDSFDWFEPLPINIDQVTAEQLKEALRSLYPEIWARITMHRDRAMHLEDAAYNLGRYHEAEWIADALASALDPKKRHEIRKGIKARKAALRGKRAPLHPDALTNQALRGTDA